MDDKSPKKEIDELEDTVKDILGKISDIDSSDEFETIEILSSIDNLVKDALTELTVLKGGLLDLIKPSSEAGSNNQESNVLMAVRRFQNAMKLALFDGASKRDLNLFEEAFNFFNNALELISSTGNQGEIEQLKSEFAQALHKIASLGDRIRDDAFNPFLMKTFQVLAEIYDTFGQYKTSISYHGRAGNILIKDPNLIIQANLEYLQAIIGYLIINEVEKAQKFSTHLKIKPVKMMADGLFSSFNEKNPESIDKIKDRVEVLGAQRRIEVKNIVYLLQNIKSKLSGAVKPSTIEKLEVPIEAIPLSNEKVNAIKVSLSKGISQFQAAHPSIQIPVAQIDTSSIVSELKKVISDNISKELKSVSDEIVVKILSGLPSGGFTTARPRSAGQISDEGVPDIEVVEGGLAPGEKPKRPKLDDMLDSIIVSE